MELFFQLKNLVLDPYRDPDGIQKFFKPWFRKYEAISAKLSFSCNSGIDNDTEELGEDAEDVAEDIVDAEDIADAGELRAMGFYTGTFFSTPDLEWE